VGAGRSGTPPIPGPQAPESAGAILGTGTSDRSRVSQGTLSEPEMPFQAGSIRRRWLKEAFDNGKRQSSGVVHLHGYIKDNTV